MIIGVRNAGNEAIMGILMAMLVLTQLEMPLLKDWAGGRLIVDFVSLFALACVIGLLVHATLRK